MRSQWNGLKQQSFLCHFVFVDPIFQVSSERDHAKQSFQAHTNVERIVSQSQCEAVSICVMSSCLCI